MTIGGVTQSELPPARPIDIIDAMSHATIRTDETRQITGRDAGAEAFSATPRTPLLGDDDGLTRLKPFSQ